MPDPTPTSERLEALKARWESDKGSRVFLQLADEYRRLGRLEDAVAVLEEGLESNKGHLGARVARSRCLVDLGRAGEAIDDLEQVIEVDPTQMVAYRLLVDAYIHEGDADKARQRLRVYGLLNDSDPDIEELSARIGELERKERTGGMERASSPSPAARAEAGDSELEDLPLTDDLPDLDDLDDLEDMDVSEAGDAEEPTPEMAASAGEPAEPPPEEQAPSPAEEAPFAEEIAADEEPEPLELPEPPEPPEPTVGEVPDPFPGLSLPEEPPGGGHALDEDLFGGAEAASGEARASAPESASVQPFEEPASFVGAGSAPEEQVPAAADEPFGPEPFEAVDPVEPAAEEESEDLFDLGRPAAEPPALGLDELEDEPAPAAERVPEAPSREDTPREEEPVPTSPGPVVAPSEPAAPPAPAAERPVEPPAAAAGEGRPTVTLGRLYLRQGHLDEAATIFREVLEREPGNDEARRGLEEVATRESAEGEQAPVQETAEVPEEAPERPEGSPRVLEASVLLEGYDPARHGEGLTARKRYALERYRELIRGSGPHVH